MELNETSAGEQTVDEAALKQEYADAAEAALAEEQAPATPQEGKLSKRQKKQYERFLNQAVTVKLLPGLVQKIVDPALAVLDRSLRETDLSLMALVELLCDKGIITEEDAEAKLKEIYDRINAEMQQQNQQSPAREQAEQAAPEGAKVERLVEPQGIPALTEDETAPRRLVEG